MSAPAPRLLLVTAGMGAGHNVVAAELARRARGVGAPVEVLDLIDAAGVNGARLQRTYRLVLRHGGWVYGAAMEAWRRWPAFRNASAGACSGMFQRVIAEAVARTHPDVVVSTYNLASQALGRLSHTGRLRVPAATLVVDPGAHPYWLAEGISLTLAPTELTAAGLREYGARRVRVIDPPLPPEFRAPPGHRRARRSLGFACPGVLVLVNAGSWAVGDVAATVETIRRLPGVGTVVLCGRNERLRSRMAARRGVLAVGWTSRMPEYLAAADVVVDNAGGQTCWQALACRTPVLLHRPLPGHGRLNAAALHGAGMARWVRGRKELRAAIRSGRFAPAPAVFAGDAAHDPLRYVLGLAGARP